MTLPALKVRARCHAGPVVEMLLHVWRLLKALARVLRHPEGRALSALVLVQLLGGTIFYTLTEGWRWLDAFYFSVTTLATVGLGDLAPETDAGKLFTVVFIFTGVGLLASFVAILARQLRRPADNEDRG